LIEELGHIWKKSQREKRDNAKIGKQVFRKVQTFNRTLNRLNKECDRSIAQCREQNEEKSVTMDDFGLNINKPQVSRNPTEAEQLASV
jgi:hypothetical protein